MSIPRNPHEFIGIPLLSLLESRAVGQHGRGQLGRVNSAGVNLAGVNSAGILCLPEELLQTE